MTESRPYHHGDLARAVLAAAITAITESGTASISLRDIARRAGVSHAAPAHHFGDKAGILTAVAVQGYELLAGALEAAQRATGDFLEVGVAYVRFAIDHRAHFEVMFRPELYHADDPALLAARSRAGAALAQGVGTLSRAQAGPGARLDEVAAWSIVHGFSTLWLDDALPPDLGDDPAVAARSVIRLLYRDA